MAKRSVSDYRLRSKGSTLNRTATDFLQLTSTEVPPEDTNVLFDKSDHMQSLLQKCAQITRESRRSVVEEKEREPRMSDKEVTESGGQIPETPKIYERWNKIVRESEALTIGLKKGTMDERTLRDAFEVEKEDEQSKLVDQFLIRNESPQALLMPVMSSWDEMVELFGDAGAVKECAPEYWEDEVSNGRSERARLIKVGIDIPAVWRIEDALQEITADLYITFTWKVKKQRDEIWDNVSREFIIPVWKVRLRNGKFISNLKDSTIMDEDMAAGNEKDGLTTIIQRITITANFSQSFDLHRFPFDVQKVEFMIRYWLIPYCSKKFGEKRGRLIFYEDIQWECRVKENALKPSDEWVLIRFPKHEYDKLRVISDLTHEKKDPKNGRRWPEIRFFFIIKRNPEFMKWNVALPITMIVVFGLIGNLTAFYSDFDRTSFTAALLFTIFSIKSNVQYALSKVGYRTTLDGYILLSQAMVILQGAVGVAFSHTTNNEVRLELPEDWDMFMVPMIFGGLGLIFWVIMTIRFWKGEKLFCCGSSGYVTPNYDEAT